MSKHLLQILNTNPTRLKNFIGIEDFFSDIDYFFDREVLQNTKSFPPYNLRKISDNYYVIELAVAGFSINDITITQQENLIKVSGTKNWNSTVKPEYVHSEIAYRDFEFRKQLAPYTYVKGAELIDGILHISIQRELPEEKAPKIIKIEDRSNNNTLSSN